MDLLSFDLNLLVLLDTLLSERSVSRTAERLGLSQPAASAALNRLRKALNDPILVRDGLRMVPTSHAEALAEPVKAILAEIEQTLVIPKAFDPVTATHTFRIGTTDYGSFILIPALIHHINAIAPNITAEIWSLPLEPEAALANGEIDLIIADGYALKQCKCTETLFPETYSCLVRKQHPRIKNQLTIEDYVREDHALVSARGRVLGSVDAILENLGLQRRVRLTIPHILAIPKIIASTDLVVTIASRIAHQFAVDYELQIFTPPFEIDGFTVQTAWHQRMTQNTALLWLRTKLIEIGWIA